MNKYITFILISFLSCKNYKVEYNKAYFIKSSDLSYFSHKIFFYRDSTFRLTEKDLVMHLSRDYCSKGTWNVIGDSIKLHIETDTIFKNVEISYSQNHFNDSLIFSIKSNNKKNGKYINHYYKNKQELFPIIGANYIYKVNHLIDSFEIEGKFKDKKIVYKVNNVEPKDTIYINFNLDTCNDMPYLQNDKIGVNQLSKKPFKLHIH